MCWRGAWRGRACGWVPARLGAVAGTGLCSFGVGFGLLRCFGRHGEMAGCITSMRVLASTVHRTCHDCADACLAKCIQTDGGSGGAEGEKSCIERSNSYNGKQETSVGRYCSW